MFIEIIFLFMNLLLLFVAFNMHVLQQLTLALTIRRAAKANITSISNIVDSVDDWKLINYTDQYIWN